MEIYRHYMKNFQIKEIEFDGDVVWRYIINL